MKSAALRRAFCGGVWGSYGYGLLRVVTGMGGIGLYTVNFVLVVEHVGHKWTMLVITSLLCVIILI